jgi:hypothetical protein
MNASVFVVFFLLFIFILLKKAGLLSLKKKVNITTNNEEGSSDGASESKQDASDKRKKRKVLNSFFISIAAVIALNVVMRTTAEMTWDFLYNMEGPFFWGMQISMFLFIFSLSMNRDEDSKPIHAGFIWAIFLITFLGFLHQPKVQKYFPKKSHVSADSALQKSSTDAKQTPSKIFTKILTPGRWYSIDVSLKYRDINISPKGNIRIQLPNGKVYDDGPGMVNNIEVGQGVWKLRALGNKPVEVRIILTYA